MVCWVWNMLTERGRRQAEPRRRPPQRGRTSADYAGGWTYQMKTIFIYLLTSPVGKTILLSAFLVLAATGACKGENLISYDADDLAADHLALANEQQDAYDRNSTMKYIHVPEFEVDGIIYSVTEYVTPKGEAGFETIIKYDNKISHMGYGPEAESRTYEDTFIDNSGNTSTSTDLLLGE